MSRCDFKNRFPDSCYKFDITTSCPNPKYFKPLHMYDSDVVIRIIADM